jgi:hypothetical protein
MQPPAQPPAQSGVHDRRASRNSVTSVGVEIGPTRVVTHALPLDEARYGYQLFKQRDGCEKVVLRP